MPLEHLDEAEVRNIREQIDAALRSTNGDTGPVEVSARVAAILLSAMEPPPTGKVTEELERVEREVAMWERNAANYAHIGNEEIVIARKDALRNAERCRFMLTALHALARQPELEVKIAKLRALAADYRSWEALDDADRQRHLRAAERIEEAIGESPAAPKRRTLKDILRVGDRVDTKEGTCRVAGIREDGVLIARGDVIGYQDILLPLRGRSSLTEPVG